MASDLQSDGTIALLDARIEALEAEAQGFLRKIAALEFQNELLSAHLDNAERSIPNPDDLRVTLFALDTLLMGKRLPPKFSDALDKVRATLPTTKGCPHRAGASYCTHCSGRHDLCEHEAKGETEAHTERRAVRDAAFVRGAYYAATLYAQKTLTWSERAGALSVARKTDPNEDHRYLPEETVKGEDDGE